MKNKIKVITPFYNPGEFLEKCIASIMSQKYENFEVIFIDDCSTDGSYDKLPKDDSRVKIMRNTERKTALENIHIAVMDHCEKDDIVVILDGDDWFPTRNVLSRVNDIYNENDCWVTWGQASWTDGRRGFATFYTPEEYANVRKAPFKISHLRTWRAGVYQKIKEQDPNFSRLKDKEGKFYRMSYDTAMMFCLLNLTPYEKAKFVDEILYIYNRSNPISEDKVDQAWQWAVHQEVSNKPNLQPISSYK
jgi:glycosyltransferase involved in cell wall biosynthesis